MKTINITVNFIGKVPDDVQPDGIYIEVCVADIVLVDSTKVEPNNRIEGSVVEYETINIEPVVD